MSIEIMIIIMEISLIHLVGVLVLAAGVLLILVNAFITMESVIMIMVILDNVLMMRVGQARSIKRMLLKAVKCWQTSKS